MIPSLYIPSSKDSLCLTDAPSGNSTKAWESSTLPGTIYSADQQCKLMLGNTAELCPGMRGGDKVSVLVRVAWCVCVYAAILQHEPCCNSFVSFASFTIYMYKYRCRVSETTPNLYISLYHTVVKRGHIV